MGIKEYLDNIKKAVKGEEVRKSIHDAIEQCYKDATGNPESISHALEEIESFKENASRDLEEFYDQVTERLQRVADQVAPKANRRELYADFGKTASICSDVFKTLVTSTTPVEKVYFEKTIDKDGFVEGNGRFSAYIENVINPSEYAVNGEVEVLLIRDGSNHILDGVGGTFGNSTAYGLIKFGLTRIKAGDIIRVRSSLELHEQSVERSVTAALDMNILYAPNQYTGDADFSDETILDKIDRHDQEIGDLKPKVEGLEDSISRQSESIAEISEIIEIGKSDIIKYDCERRPTLDTMIRCVVTDVKTNDTIMIESNRTDMVFIVRYSSFDGNIVRPASDEPFVTTSDRNLFIYARNSDSTPLSDYDVENTKIVLHRENSNPNAIERLDSDMKNVKELFDDVKELVNVNENITGKFRFLNYGSITITDEIMESSVFCYTDYIPMSEYAGVYAEITIPVYTTSLGEQATNCIAFYDSDKNRIDYVQTKFGNTGFDVVRMKLPDNLAYVRSTYIMSIKNTYSFVVSSGLNDEIKKLMKYISELKDTYSCKKPPTSTTEVCSLFDALVSKGYCNKNILGTPNGENLCEYVFDIGRKWLSSDGAETMNNTALFNRPTIGIIGCVHGDERASCMMIYEFCKLIFEKETLAKYRNAFVFRVIPVANPYGYTHNQRTTATGIDLNRDAPTADTAEGKIIKLWLESYDFDFVFDMHQTGYGQSNQSENICAFLTLPYPINDKLMKDVSTRYMMASGRTETEFNKLYGKDYSQLCYVWTGSSTKNWRNWAHNNLDNVKIMLSCEMSFATYHYSGSNVMFNDISNSFNTSLAVNYLCEMMDYLIGIDT